MKGEDVDWVPPHCVKDHSVEADSMLLVLRYDVSHVHLPMPRVMEMQAMAVNPVGVWGIQKHDALIEKCT
jgi:hypothetical protein